MKKIFLFLAVVGMTAIQSCEGPEGPTGYSAESEVFEVTNVDFTPANDYFQTYILDPVILPSDNILVYELVNTNDGIDTWALLPQIYYFDAGQAQYNFSFSYDQFSLFIDTDFDFDLLPTSFTQNKIFRIVIVPGQFSKLSLDTEDYNSVISTLGIDDTKVKMLNRKN
jgi:hypothetical protein